MLALSMKHSAEDVVRGVTRLPTPPAVYQKVKELIADDNATTPSVARVISTDPGLSAALLRSVNGALYGFPRQIDSVAKAVDILGLNRVLHIVTATTMATLLSGLAPRTVDINAFWRSSMLRALTTRALANLRAHRDAERMFLVGLLSDSGHLLMAQRCPDLTENALELAEQSGAPLWQVEREIVGCDYAQVGALLLETWKLPEVLVNLVRDHPSLPGEAAHSMDAGLLHIGTVLQRMTRLETAAGGWSASVHPDAWQSTGLKLEDCEDAMQVAIAALQSMLATFFPAGAANRDRAYARP